MRSLFHTLVSIVLWGVFFYHWHIVGQQGMTAGTALAIKVLSTLVVVGLTITLLWVFHNLRVARLNQRRDLPPSRPESLRRDTLGRTVTAPPLSQLKEAPLVDIQVTEDHKTYSLPPVGT